ncbi:efflux RND transporter permease subunit, partial [bacterium]|nr:efflux RND transporter permease subunit [bacterium]
QTDLAAQVRGAFFGAEAMRIQRGKNEVKVMVRYPESSRTSVADVENLRIRTPQGIEIPLYRAAYVEESRGYSEVRRTDRERVINVTAKVDNRATTPDDIIANLEAGILPQLLSDYPGLSYDLEGQSRDQMESMSSLFKGFIIAQLIIFALLAILFRSYTQPLVVMSAVPFGIVGAVIGHLVLGYNLSLISMFGIVALGGVVVNDSLVMIDFINMNRRNGVGLRESVLESGVRRFRPIIMTSLTTFFGLVPIMLETSIQAKFLIPMAISLGFGVLFATAITLVLIPAFYLVLEDIHDLFGSKSYVETPEVEEVKAIETAS